MRVAVAEDQRLFRELLAELLAREPDITVDGSARSGSEALELARARRPDVLLLDIGLPDLDGVEVARVIQREAPEVRVIALSIHEEPYVVRRMLEAGVRGYVLKSAALAELVGAVRAVARGAVYLSPEIAEIAIAARLAEGSLRGARLGPRERQVVALVAEGKRSADIAAALHISSATVEAHRRNIMRKLGVHSVAELTKFALREGLASL